MSMESPCCGVCQFSEFCHSVARIAYVEGTQLRAVGIEGLVVELYKLLCKDIRRLSCGLEAAPVATHSRCSRSLAGTELVVV